MSMPVQNLVSDKPPLLSLLLILLNVFLGFALVGPLVGLGVASLFYEGEILNDIQSPLEHTNIIGPLLITQAIASFIGLILFPLIQLTAVERKALSPFFPAQPRTLLMFLLISLLGLTFVISISPLAEWNVNLEFPEFMKGFETWARQTEDQASQLVQTMTNFNSTGDFVVGLLVIALLPAVGEELVFRGMFQNEFFRGTRNIHISIWMSALIFSAIHLQFYGFIPRLLLGALFGYLYYWSGNLLIPMFAHFFNNAFGITMLYLYHQKIITINVEDTTAFPLPYVIINLILTGGLLYYIHRHFRELPKPEQLQKITYDN